MFSLKNKFLKISVVALIIMAVVISLLLVSAQWNDDSQAVDEADEAIIAENVDEAYLNGYNYIPGDNNIINHLQGYFAVYRVKDDGIEYELKFETEEDYLVYYNELFKDHAVIEMNYDEFILLCADEFAKN